MDTDEITTTDKLFAILVPTLPERKHYLQRLLKILEPQVNNKPVKIFIDPAPKGASIGAKRNNLVQTAKDYLYIGFVDDDDRVSGDYVDRILKALQSNPDVVGIEGTMTTNGRDPRKFIHSLKYDHWFEENKIYYRMPNHLNPVKSSLAIQLPFPEINHGEDHDYSKRLLPLLKTEVYLDDPVYFYDFRSRK